MAVARKEEYREEEEMESNNEQNSLNSTLFMMEMFFPIYGLNVLPSSPSGNRERKCFIQG